MSKLKYFTLHRKESALNNISEPKKNKLPQVGRLIVIQGTQRSGNEKVQQIECIVKKEYPSILQVEVIQKINSRTNTNNKAFTYSASFMKSDFSCGLLSYRYK